MITREVAERRSHTRLVTLRGDQFVRVQDSAGFIGAIQDFPRTLDVASA
ncbi:hypothetical protein [Nonomuraea sp. NPDC001023]